MPRSTDPLTQEALAKIGFNSLTDLHRATGIGTSTLSRTFSSKPKRLPKNKFLTLIQAVHQRKYQDDALSYKESAELLAETLVIVWESATPKDCMMTDLANLKTKIIELSDSLSEEFFQTPTIISTCRFANSNQEEEHVEEECVLDLIMNPRSKFAIDISPQIKHDFDAQATVEVLIKNQIPSISRTLKSEMRARNYDSVYTLFSKLKYALHLCEEFDLVEVISTWLMNKASLQGNELHLFESKVMLIWTLTSRGTKDSLKDAHENLNELSNLWKRGTIKDKINPDNADSLALYLELLVRLPLRSNIKLKKKLDPQAMKSDFDKARGLLEILKRTPGLEPRLQERYRIGLLYQQGLHEYLCGKFESSKSTFNEIYRISNCIGWRRVEIGSISWLATLCLELNLLEETNSHLLSLSALNMRNNRKRTWKMIREKLDERYLR